MEFARKHPFLVVLALTVFLWMIGVIKTDPQRVTEPTPKYESTWHNDFHKGISVALAKNNARDCGEYAYKATSDSSEEYLVRCTSGRTYRKEGSGEATKILFYQVFPNINSVVGPFSEKAGAR